MTKLKKKSLVAYLYSSWREDFNLMGYTEFCKKSYCDEDYPEYYKKVRITIEEIK